MKNMRVESQKNVYKFTNPTIMRFQPLQDFQQPQEPQKTNFFNRLRAFFSPPSKPKSKSPLKRPTSIGSDIRPHPLKRSQHKNTSAKLKYVKRLTNEDILIGNEDQLDAMCLSGIIKDFVDTQYLWSLNIKRPILHVAIDYKKNYIILLPEKEVMVFQFDPRLIVNKPVFINSIKLSNDVRFVQVVKDGSFVLCYSTGIQLYSVQENNMIRINLQKKYTLPSNELKLLQVPQPYQNILNIFFLGETQNPKYISLWNIEIQFLHKEIKMKKATKVYDFESELRNIIRLQNYSKQIYFINLGRQILAIRKGYFLDSANVDIKSGNNHLKYMFNKKLVHVSDIKVQIYNFELDMEMNPPKIILNSTDSMEIPDLKHKFQYFNCVELFNQNFAVFFQTKQDDNRIMNGEIKYCFIVTHLIKMEDKIVNILPKEIKNMDIMNIDDKADMVKKMGLQRKDIYLRLWNNSEKNSIQDFRILLDTLDYDTIKNQIEKKLKKTSMNFRQVLLLQQGCLSMLSQNVFGATNTKEDIKNYFISHLLIRKLQFYKQISLIERASKGQEDCGKLLINIQNYNYYKTIDIKTMLFQLINRYCNEDKNQILKIRAILRFFRFPLRIVYQSIIPEIIFATKKKFLKILEAIPQLLHYQPTLQLNENEEDPRLYEGIWKETTVQQWQKSLYIDTVSTIDNQQNLYQVCSSVWFKRYWLTQHQFINFTKSQIQEIHRVNRSQATFYNAIDKIFEVNKQYGPLRQIIDFIQDNYPKLPQHLYGKIFLYRKLFEHFKQNQKTSQFEKSIDTFAQFLKLKDDDLFKAMFNYQKVKKGFILKEMKPLYCKLAGVEVFHEGLLNYFASNKSNISDIKYLLNRMNNEKKQFHQQNQGIYEVLVKGMQLKLKLGSEQDVPIDEVLIYITNIPLSENNPVMRDLELMRLINQESHRFKQIKLNMTIFDMTKNIDSVIAALVHFQIDKAKILEKRDPQQIKDATYKIIADIQIVKEKIFPRGQHSDLTLFAYITKVLEEQELVKIVKEMLQDQWINKHFTINETIIQNFVLYMYKWKLTKEPIYTQSSKYLKQLSSLLPISNVCREYIEAQIQIAQILSNQAYSITYPLSNDNQFFTSFQLQRLINNISGQHLLTINLQKLYQCALKVQQISSDRQLNEITLPGTYETLIIRLIDCGMLKDAIQKIKPLIQIQGNNAYSFIFPSILAAKIAPELIQENKNLLLECSTYLFKEPLKLLDLLDELMSTKGTNQEHKVLLLKYFQGSKLSNLSFNPQNPIFDQNYIKCLQSENDKRNFQILLRETITAFQMQRQQYGSNPLYYMIYNILCNDPYVLVKYILCNKFNINFKEFRCFVSIMSKQDFFNKIHFLEFMKRTFNMLHISIAQNRNIEQIIDQFRNIPFDNCQDAIKITQPRNQLEKKIHKSLERFKLKIKAATTELEKRKSKGLIEGEQSRTGKIKQKLANPKAKYSQFEYNFPDSDDNPKNKDANLNRFQVHDKKAKQEEFDPKFQRAYLMDRKLKGIGNYVLIQKQRRQKNFYYAQKISKDAISGLVPVDKNVQEIMKKGIDEGLTDCLRNSLRRSKCNPQKKSNLFLNDGKYSEYGNGHGTQIENDKNIIQNSDITQRISSKIIAEKVTAKSRQIAIAVEQVQRYEQSIIQKNKIPEFGSVLAQTKIISLILKDGTEIKQNTQLDFTVLEQFKNNGKFSDFLKELTKVIYNKNNITFKQVLLFIKKLNEAYPVIGINIKWLQVYLTAVTLQTKFNLNLPLKNIFLDEGLFIDSQLSERLFNFLLPNIISNLNQQQLLKTCKVITLAFKKSQFEQQILFSYLLQLFTNLQRSIYNPNIDEFELNMMRQKIAGITDKIPTKLLKKKQSEMLHVLIDEQVRLQVGKILINSLTKRYDTKTAQFFQEKWIQKLQKPSLVQQPSK